MRDSRAPLADWIAARFRAKPLADDAGNATGLITGYHEPELSGSLQRESPRQTPLYRRPHHAPVAQAHPARSLHLEEEGLDRVV